MPFINCADASLEVFSPTTDKPWDRQRVVHLARRIAMGASPEIVTTALAISPEGIVDSLVDEAISMPLAPEPPWAYWMLSDYSPDENIRTQQIINQIFGWGTQWLKDIQENGLRDRMSWFWHNHFVTRNESYTCPSYMYQYHKLLQKYAVGNFKEFVREMGVTPAMLLFLNGVQSTRFDPNENYARELYELFTLGVDNGYTQEDIVETARALTGWNGIDVEDFCGPIEFVPAFWDPDSKTIFGQTGNWGYDDVIDLLFANRGVEISEFICAKLYRNFVNPKEDEEIIMQLAETFRNSNFEISAVLRQLFKSEHFFDSAHIGTIIPGHIEYFIMFMNEIGFAYEETISFAVGYSATDFNQAIFNPTDVSGWPGNRNWVTSQSLPYRWEGITNIMGYYYSLQNETIEQVRDFAINLTSATETDPELIVRAVVDFILPKGFQFPAEYAEALAVFKGEIPENYFEDKLWNLNWDYVPFQMFELLVHIANQPEFQLK